MQLWICMNLADVLISFQPYIRMVSKWGSITYSKKFQSILPSLDSQTKSLRIRDILSNKAVSLRHFFAYGRGKRRTLGTREHDGSGGNWWGVGRLGVGDGIYQLSFCTLGLSGNLRWITRYERIIKPELERCFDIPIPGLFSQMSHP